MPSKSVTLYLEEDTIERLNRFAELTFRSKSGAADLLLLHGIANYDIVEAAPKPVAKVRKATKVTTRVKEPKPVAMPGVKKRGRPVGSTEKATTAKPKTRAKRKAAPKAAPKTAAA